MRIIAEMPHPDCKISIFSMNGKFIIKFEQGGLEQTYKLAEVDMVDGVNGVFQILDDEFMATVVERFSAMRGNFNDAYKRHEY
ncbi:MAG TPA: hypothetical protein VGD90_02830 [Sphingobacteriaceae bacterium]